MIHYYDWEGNYKMVAIAAGRTWLVDASTNMAEFAERCHSEWGYLPSITSVVLVDQEFFERWKDAYQAKGYLMCSSEQGGVM